MANEYVPFSTISWLPNQLAERAAKVKCMIPKNIVWSGGIKIPATSIIVGEFATRGQYDIAVICHNEKEDRIFIHWGGPVKCPSEINSWGESIGIVGEQFIEEHYHMYEGATKPPEITHDAINDLFIGKSSVVNYCHDGQWLKLQGAD